MQKIFINEIPKDQRIILDSQKTKHFLKVLRMKKNDQIIVVSNNEKYLATLINTTPCTFKINQKIDNKTNNNFEINIIFGAIKSKNLELAIKKAVELNANNFYIYYFDYSQNNEKYNMSRLQQIILSASEQSNRDNLMNIKIIYDNELINILNNNDINLVAHFDKNAKTISSTLNSNHNKIGIVIGPEGGFSQKDLTLLNNKNNCIISLTKTILRSETALIYALSVINETKLGGECEY